LENHVLSQRAGRPLRSAEQSGAQARRQSASIESRCTLRSRQPIVLPLCARWS
jgi:hypothetical protein